MNDSTIAALTNAADTLHRRWYSKTAGVDSADLNTRRKLNMTISSLDDAVKDMATRLAIRAIVDMWNDDGIEPIELAFFRSKKAIEYVVHHKKAPSATSDAGKTLAREFKKSSKDMRVQVDYDSVRNTLLSTFDWPALPQAWSDRLEMADIALLNIPSTSPPRRACWIAWRSF